MWPGSLEYFTPMSDSEPSHPTPSPAEPQTPLGFSLRADYEALRNDLDQAKELAGDFQRQLAGKSNEVAHFKSLLERTQRDLTRLDEHVQELRRERHRLANDAMKAQALELELKRTREEIGRLRTEVEVLRQAGSGRMAELQIVNEEQQKEIGRLRAAIEVLRQRESAAVAPPPTETHVQRELADLRAMVHQLQGLVQPRPGRPVPPAARDADATASESDIINISFER